MWDTQESHWGLESAPKQESNWNWNWSRSWSWSWSPVPSTGLSTYVACVGNKLFIRVCLLLFFQLFGAYYIFYCIFVFLFFLFSCLLLFPLLFAVCLPSVFLFLFSNKIFIYCASSETRRNKI